MDVTGYGGLFLSAFLAATFIPLSSEAALTALLALERFDPWILLIVASLGNVLGSLLNWYLGRFCLHYQDRRWFPLKPAALEKAQTRFRKWGLWSLLLAWMPVIGDPLTFAAGIMRVPLRHFLPLVIIAKTGRYLIVTAGFLQFTA